LLKQLNDRFVSNGDKENPNELPKAQKGEEWLSLGYENKFYNYKNNPDFFDSHARLHDNSRANQWIKDRVYSGEWEYNPVTQETRKVKPENKADVSAETKTLAKDVRTWTKEEKVAHPASTIKNLPRTEVEQLRKEDAGFDQYATTAEKEAGKRTAAAQSKAMVNNLAFYAPGAAFLGVETLPALWGAELLGTGLTVGNVANAGFIGQGVYNTLDPDSDMRRSWSEAYNNPTKSNLWDATLETGLNSLNFLGAKSLPGDIKAFGNAYNKIATGNSVIPYAWRSPAIGLSQEKSAEMFKGLLNSGQLTPAEKALVIEYQSNSRPFTGRSTAGVDILNTEKRAALNDLIKKYNLDVNSDAILTRRFNFDRGTLGTGIENGRMNFGDRPTSFSAGVGLPGYGGASDRLVIPNRYVKKMGNNFLANPYEKASDDVLTFLEGNPTAKDFALNAPSLNEAIIAERELIGTGLDFKQIGKVKNDIGGFDYVVKPKNIKGGTNINSGDKTFKSEIDWAKWNPETPNYPELINEYNTIEQTTKGDGTWMKNPDGSAFQGSPEQFVQQQSSYFKKAFGDSQLLNPDGSPMFLYHGSAKKFNAFDPSMFQLGDAGYSGAGIYTTPSKTTANSYALSSAKFHSGDIQPTVYELYGQGNKPIKASDLIKENANRDLFNFNRDANFKGPLSDYESLRNYDVAIADQLPGVENIRPINDAREIVFPTNTQVKSATGNVGFFDMRNPNIYKTLLPPAVLFGAGAMTQQKKRGGPVNKRNHKDLDNYFTQAWSKSRKTA
jgi:hypothetical protein